MLQITKQKSSMVANVPRLHSQWAKLMSYAAAVANKKAVACPEMWRNPPISALIGAFCRVPGHTRRQLWYMLEKYEKSMLQYCAFWTWLFDYNTKDLVPVCV